MPNLSWRNAIIQVLRDNAAAMHYSDITEQILEQGLRSQVGATPSSSVSATLTMSMRDEGAASPFIRVARGEYLLREAALDPAKTSTTPGPLDDAADVIEDEIATGIIHAFGMYWQRDLVKWTSNCNLLGRQQIKADAVDFCGQKGVYLLHDHREAVYVGRAVERPLGQRLYEHTQDRLNGRWNRFSWFGVLRVTDVGDLEESSLPTEIGLWIVTMEALLIEGLEPRQNRRRGDDFSAIEYLQAEDPEIAKQQMVSLLHEMQQKLT